MSWVKRWLGAGVTVIPDRVLEAFIAQIWERRPSQVVQAVGPYLSRKPTLDTMPFDLVPNGVLQFEHLAGLFSSTPFDRAVVTMSVRQTAYLFGLVRHMRPRKVIEIGRYKGGSTLVIAAAMNGEGEFWSIDIGEKEARLSQSTRSYDVQFDELRRRFGLKVNVLVGDSRTIELDTGAVDLVFIDGDHSYVGVKSDFDRFGRRVRLGGAVLLDDAVDDGFFTSHSDTVGRLLSEVIADREFRLVKTVNHLAHLERIRPISR